MQRIRTLLKQLVSAGAIVAPTIVPPAAPPARFVPGQPVATPLGPARIVGCRWSSGPGRPHWRYACRFRDGLDYDASESGLRAFRPTRAELRAGLRQYLVAR